MSRPAYIFNERGAPVIYISNSDPIESFTMSALGRASVYIGVLLLPSLGKAPPLRAQNPDDAEKTRAIHLLQRATYGPRQQDVDALTSAGIRAWLDLQLHPERIDDAALEPRLPNSSLATTSVQDLLDQFPPGQVLQPLR